MTNYVYVVTTDNSDIQVFEMWTKAVTEFCNLARMSLDEMKEDPGFEETLNGIYLDDFGRINRVEVQ